MWVSVPGTLDVDGSAPRGRNNLGEKRRKGEGAVSLYLDDAACVDKICAYRDPGTQWLEGMNLATRNPGHQQLEHSCFVEVSKPQHILSRSSLRLAFQFLLSTSAACVKAADVSCAARSTAILSSHLSESQHR